MDHNIQSDRNERVIEIRQKIRLLEHTLGQEDTIRTDLEQKKTFLVDAPQRVETYQNNRLQALAATRQIIAAPTTAVSHPVRTDRLLQKRSALLRRSPRETTTEPPACFLSRNGQVYGPYSRDQLLAFARSGQLAPTDPVFIDPQQGWVTAADVLC